jgi:hypothetical protein
MGVDWIFFTPHKRFVDDICTYGRFENMYAGLQLFMVAVRTDLFATLSICDTRWYVLMMVRNSEVRWE